MQAIEKQASEVLLLAKGLAASFTSCQVGFRSSAQRRGDGIVEILEQQVLKTAALHLNCSYLLVPRPPKTFNSAGRIF